MVSYGPHLAPLLTALVLLGYAGSFWWLLRRESGSTLLALAALCGASLALRLVQGGDFPAGLHEDEPKILTCVLRSMRNGYLFGEDCTGLPVFLNAIFQGQLVPLLGPGRWSIRLYSHVTSVLCTPLAFAAARALGMRTGASLAAGALVAVLPWSIFWGRIAMGGEIPFHQLLLLAALARLIWQRGGLAEVGIGGLGLCLLLYDYWGGRAMLGMPFVAAVLATGHRRILCLTVLLVALAGWWPYISWWPPHLWGGANELMHPDLFAHPFAVMQEGLLGTARIFVEPAGLNGALTVAGAAVHPPLVLAVAALGTIASWRRGLFLWAGFLGGIFPAVVSISGYPSAHRIMTSFPFLLLAASSGLDMIRWRGLRTVVTAAVVSIAGYQSIAFYFSPDFWTIQSRARFDAYRTEVIEAVPYPSPEGMIAAPMLGYFFQLRGTVETNWDWLHAENWIPSEKEKLIYIFGAHEEALRTFYERLLGSERIEAHGRAFLVRTEPRDWSWLREHGWTYEAWCRDVVRRTHVPVLFQTQFSFPNLDCGVPIVHVWRGRWLGAPAKMELRFLGSALVETSDGVRVESALHERRLWFDARPGAEIKITVTESARVQAVLFESTPVGQRVPDWEHVTPISDFQP